jgi:hypothetical protein
VYEVCSVELLIGVFLVRCFREFPLDLHYSPAKK